MKKIHFEGWADKMDLADLLSDNYEIGLSFDFDEESSDSVDNIFLRFYESEDKCTLNEAMEGHLNQLFGKLEATGQMYGYSEYTIEGFSVHTLKLGGHDIGKILKERGHKYVHVLIEQVKS